jgi:hypothetical protein
VTTPEQAAGRAGPAATTPLRPDDARPAGGCRTCRHGRGPRCLCSCLDVFHDLPKRKAGRARTRCNHCPDCTTYHSEEETHVVG